VCLNAEQETRVTRGHRISLTFRHKYKWEEINVYNQE
jgi:hypothetical protein